MHGFEFDWQTGTLSSLLTLADTVTKYDVVFQNCVDKIVGESGART